MHNAKFTMHNYLMIATIVTIATIYFTYYNVKLKKLLFSCDCNFFHTALVTTTFKVICKECFHNLQRFLF